METFIELKELVENSHYRVQRRKALCKLTDDMIDVPIIRLIKGFNRLPYCFTLQSVSRNLGLSDDKKEEIEIETLKELIEDWTQKHKGYELFSDED